MVIDSAILASQKGRLSLAAYNKQFRKTFVILQYPDVMCRVNSVSGISYTVSYNLALQNSCGVIIEVSNTKKHLLRTLRMEGYDS